MVDGDRRAAVGGEGDGLIDELLGEVEGDEVLVTESVHGDTDAASSATGFKERSGTVGKSALDHDALAGPKAELVGSFGVVNDGAEVVEIAANLSGSNGGRCGNGCGGRGHGRGKRISGMEGENENENE